MKTWPLCEDATRPPSRTPKWRLLFLPCPGSPRGNKRTGVLLVSHCYTQTWQVSSEWSLWMKILLPSLSCWHLPASWDLAPHSQNSSPHQSLLAFLRTSPTVQKMLRPPDPCVSWPLHPPPFLLSTWDTQCYAHILDLYNKLCPPPGIFFPLHRSSFSFKQQDELPWPPHQRNTLPFILCHGFCLFSSKILSQLVVTNPFLLIYIKGTLYTIKIRPCK